MQVGLAADNRFPLVQDSELTASKISLYQLLTNYWGSSLNHKPP